MLNEACNLAFFYVQTMHLLLKQAFCAYDIKKHAIKFGT